MIQNMLSNSSLSNLSLSSDELQVYKDHLLSGTILLLGYSPELIPISNHQIDVNTWLKYEIIIDKDWFDKEKYYDNIIGDAILNYSKELTDSILDMCKKNCGLFITRCFKNKLPIMEIVDYFPKENEFKIRPDMVLEYNDYDFLLWRFLD